jgi:hypothetical protein
MALHRDIYWVGKQWAVTGHGIQACNQKQKGRFDIEGSKLWEDGVQDAVRRLKWVKVEDFDQAVAVARKYYPEPPRKKPAPAPAVPPPVHMAPAPEPEPPKLAQPQFAMRFEGVAARLRPVWRIRTPR